ncbi:MAG: toll/interleukin-1 receptor domain-containing protein [Pseudomonadota bacterium]
MERPSTASNAREQRFSAFISYSHADAAAVRKLHSQIESYRLPKGLGSIDALNGRKGKVGKIFRDREDLSAAEDLSVAVKDALGRSEVLVVACSPDAKASQWVDQEIAYFRECHPDRPILAAILRGEPAEAFPATLTQGGIEPLAADLRKQGDGWRLGFLKVIAGIVGVPLDALVQRDGQRQIRRVMAVTGLVAVIAIAMGVMTTIALQARNEAQTLRASSDAFIDELLSDGREDLIAVGRLDILDKFNERALRFYTSQGDVSELPVDSLENWATILHAMGEDETKKTARDLDKALEYFQAAHDATEELLRRDPQNADRIFGHAQSEYWVGRIAELKEDWSFAEHHFLRYAEAAKRLVDIQPANPEFLLEMAWGQLNLGIIEVRSRSGSDFGETRIERAIGWMERARNLDPENDFIFEEIGNAYAWLADSHFLKQDYQSSTAARKIELQTKKAWLKRQPRNAAAKYAVAKSEFAVGYNLTFLGEDAESKEHISSALKHLDELVELDPKNENWKRMRDRILDNK